MTLPAAYPQTVTVGRQADKDRFGDPVGIMDTHEIDGCTPYPTTSSETMNRSDTVITGQGLLLPYGSDIQAADVVWLAGDDLESPAPWQVSGDPGSYQSPFTGWQAGMQVELTKYKG